MTERVVLVGGGFGGAWAARGLERRLRPGEADLTLLDRNNYFIFYPLLVEAGTGALEPRHTVVSQRAMFRRCAFRMAEVEGVDFEKQEVVHRLGGDGRDRRMPYDHLVLSLGSVTKTPPVEGLEEHGWEMKGIADAIALQDRAIRLLEIASCVDDERRRRALLHVVIVGASFTGAELAGEYHAFLRRAARRYPGLDPRECNVTLVEMMPRILPALDEELAGYATKQMQRRGIRVLLETKVRRIGKEEVELDDGQVLDACTTVWCAGVAPHPLVETLGLPTVEGGWIECERTLRVKGHENIWAIGDCAANPGPDGTPYPATAQHAVKQGEHAARNVVAALRGGTPTACDIEGAGTLAPLGCRTAVAQLFGVKVSGFAAWWLFRTVYLFKMPGLVRKLRVLADWNLNLLLPREPVQLGVTPSWAAAPPRKLGVRGSGEPDPA